MSKGAHMTHIVNWQTAIRQGIKHSRPEVNNLPSQTVPGMTMSLEELLRRYVRGENVQTFQPVYAGDADIPDFDNMTEMDRLDMARELREFVDRRQWSVPDPKPLPKPEPAPVPEPTPEPEPAPKR